MYINRGLLLYDFGFSVGANHRCPLQSQNGWPMKNEGFPRSFSNQPLGR